MELLAPRPHLLHDGHCGNWASLRRRTLAGLPIRMLAYGSSIVGSGGGCTAAVPGICEASACPRCCGLSCTGETGWAREVFNEWNRSFPHAESDLLSIGQPGGGLATTLSSCLRDYVSALRFDVILLEFAVTGKAFELGEQLESVISMLVHDQQRGHGQRPLILFTSFSHVARTKLTAADEAKARRKYADNAAAVQRVAQRHGYPHWSPLPVLGGLSPETAALAWKEDFLHVRSDYGSEGKLSRACRADPSLKRCRSANASLTGQRVVPSRRELEARVEQSSKRELEARVEASVAALVSLPIYLAIARGVRECADDVAPPVAASALEVPPRWSCLRWRNNGTFAAPSLAERFRVVSPHDAGWANVTHERSKSQWRVKPGLRGETAGARWRVALDPPDRGKSFVLRLEYLTSYEKLGAAELTCAAGCRCAPRLLNASAPRLRVSVNTVEDVAVERDGAADERCVVELRVVEPAFKLSSLAFSTDAVLGRLPNVKKTWNSFMDADNMQRMGGALRGDDGDNFNGMISEEKPQWMVDAERKAEVERRRQEEERRAKRERRRGAAAP